MSILSILALYVAGVVTGITLVLIILWQWAISDQKKQDLSWFGNHRDYADHPVDWPPPPPSASLTPHSPRAKGL